MNNSLLPPNATLLERDIERIINQATDIPVTIKTLWDPKLCPAELLPWLAWAYSVDQWMDSWPEQIKRQVINDAFVIHQHKGTPFAVQHALNALGIKTQIREWWEDGINGQPGTMTVLALINQNITADADGLLTNKMLKLITEAIHAAKRGSLHFELELGISLEESLALSGGLSFGVGVIDLQPDATAVVPDDLDAASYLTLVDHSINCIDNQLNLAPVLPDTALFTLQFAAVSQLSILSDLILIGEL